MAKLIAYCDSPACTTGFGRVAREILTLVHQTFDVDIKIWGINHNNRSGDGMPFQIIDASKNQLGETWDEEDPFFGRESFSKLLEKEKFDCFWSVQDAFNMKPITQTLARLRTLGKEFKSIFYFPVDAGLLPLTWCETAVSFDHPVVYTEFGKQEVLRRVGDLSADKLKVAYHGNNYRDFYPLPEKEKLEMRNKLRVYGNQFVFMNLNRNQPRKDIPTTLMAFHAFLKWWKEQGFKTAPPKLILHMNPIDPCGDNLMMLRDSFFADIADHIIFPSNAGSCTTEELNQYHNAADCLVSTSMGEGWGLTTTEAMAAGTPVIVPRNTANMEIIGEVDEVDREEGDGIRGWLTKSGHTPDHWRAMSGCTHYGDPLRPVTSAVDLARKMRSVFTDCTNEKGERTAPKGRTLDHIEKAREWVSDMPWQKVFKEVWEPLFALALPYRK